MKNLLLACVLLISGCTEKPENPSGQLGPKKESAVTEIVLPKKELSETEVLRAMNDSVISVIKKGDMQKFTNFIHPDKGVSFSMYAFIDPTVDKHFSHSEFERYAATPVKFTWGNLDGTGDPLVCSISEYFKKWLFVRDFTKAEVIINSFRGSGNSLNNLKKVFPHADFTENYLPGSEEYSGMDWKALRFVFEQYEGQYYLIAVINDQWTI